METEGEENSRGATMCSLIDSEDSEDAGATWVVSGDFSSDKEVQIVDSCAGSAVVGRSAGGNAGGCNGDGAEHAQSDEEEVLLGRK